MFSHIFWGYQKKPMAGNGLMRQIFWYQNIQSIIKNVTDLDNKRIANVIFQKIALNQIIKRFLRSGLV